MITLYDYLPSQNAYKIRLLLNQLQQTYHTEIVSIFEGHGQRENYLAINPTGAVPAIQLEDGRVIAESNAILGFLAEGSSYLPDTLFERAKVYQWMSFEADYVQSTIGVLRHWIMTGKDKNRPAQLLESKRHAALKTLRILDRELATRPFVGGDYYTIADISVFAYAHRAEEANLPLLNYPHMMQWIDRIRSQSRFLDKVYPYSIDPYSSNELP